MGNKNMTGGSFDSGVPSNCFRSDNPCSEAGSRAELGKTTLQRKEPTIAGFDQPGDDHRAAAPHFLNQEQGQ
jgi:hypothetical protein